MFLICAEWEMYPSQYLHLMIYSGEYNPTSIFLLRLGKNIVDGKYGQSITKLQFERRQTTQFPMLTQ